MRRTTTKRQPKRHQKSARRRYFGSELRWDVFTARHHQPSLPKGIERIVDKELAARLAAAGAVLIEGPKACGKTETARQLTRHEFRFDVDQGARALVAASPQTLFDQESPILLDEWQVAPALWELVRRDVDDHWPERGRIILTGSATPVPDAHRHT